MTDRPSSSERIRVVVCWAEASAYMAACWREMTADPAIDLHVIHVDSLSGTPPPLDVETLMQGISHEMFGKDRPDLDAYLLKAVTDRRPDVVVFCGWIFWPYTRLINAAPLARVKKLLGMDTPWRGTVAQRLARFRLSHFIHGLDLVVTAGERSAEYARRIGVPEGRLRSGYYGFDQRAFAAAAGARTSWPRQFLFVGRYVPEKDLGTLCTAYDAYRKSVSNPWGLTCSGAGPEKDRLRDLPGVTDIGFTPPQQLPEVFSRHGVFVLPSRFEPWGVVIAEASGAGIPVVCSSACGAALEIVRSYYNGLIVPPGDPAALARAMRWMHDHEADLPAMGRRGAALSEAFSAQAWAARWRNYFREVLDPV